MSAFEAPAVPHLHSDDVGTELVARARVQSRLRLSDRSEQVAVALAGAFVVSAAGAVIFPPAVRPFSLTAALIAVLGYAIVSRVVFEVSNGAVLPTQLVLVPMLFTLPPRSVPLVVAAGMLLGQAPDFARKQLPLSHIPIQIANATHALGPAVVLALAGTEAPSWRHTPVYLGALAAQFAADLIPGTIYSRVPGAFRSPSTRGRCASRSSSTPHSRPSDSRWPSPRTAAPGRWSSSFPSSAC